MVTKQIHFFWFLTGLIFLSLANLSCNKENENVLPVITIISPLENTIYGVPDLIPIHAEIEDDKLINSIVVVLVDKDLKPLTTSKNYFPNSKTYTLIYDFLIPDENLNTGNYYLKIQANDDYNYKNEFIKIYLEAAPTKLEQIVVLTESGNNQINVSGITNFETIVELFSIEGDYSASEISSEHHKLFISGIEKINLQAYDLTINQLDWEKGIIPHWPMHNSGCLHFDEWLYVTFDYRNIFGYDYKGIEKYNSEVEDFEAPGRIYKHNNYILTDIQKKNGTNPFISIFHAASGVEANRLNTTFEVVNFISLSDDIVLIIANTDENAYIGEYNVKSNILKDLIFTETQFLSSVGINSSTIYISTSDNISLYNPNSNVLSPVLQEQGVKHMVYEKISDLLIISTNNELLLLNPPEMTNQKTLLFSDLILNIHLLYSK